MIGLCDIGVIGLGVMGANLARNLAGRGFKVAGYDREAEPGRALARDPAILLLDERQQ